MPYILVLKTFNIGLLFYIKNSGYQDSYQMSISARSVFTALHEGLSKCMTGQNTPNTELQKVRNLGTRFLTFLRKNIVL